MRSLKECIKEAETGGQAIGHFNISNLEGLWGVFRAAQKLDLPVIIGVSEGERDFVGVRQAVALVQSLREEYKYPIFLNADHTYSLDRAKEAIDAGFDAVIIDGAQLPFKENIKITKECVQYARAKNPGIVVEGELGYIGTSSKLLDKVPEGVVVEGNGLTTPEEAGEFVAKTGVDLLAPAVGNVHGMMKTGHDPKLDIERIRAIRATAGVPLVLHGGSGTMRQDFIDSIKAGMSVIHINTELRIAYRRALEKSLSEDLDEIAPYKYLKSVVSAVEKATEEKLMLFSKSE